MPGVCMCPPLTCRLPAPARCMAWIVSSTLLRSLISTEVLVSSGIWTEQLNWVAPYSVCLSTHSDMENPIMFLVDLPYLSLDQLVPDGQHSPHRRVDPWDMVNLYIKSRGNPIWVITHFIERITSQTVKLLILLWIHIICIQYHIYTTVYQDKLQI